MKGTTRRLVQAAFIVAVILLGANAVRLGIERARAQTLPTVPSGSVVVPYTVVLAEQIVGASGKTQVGPSQTWAVRSDGARSIKMGDGKEGNRLVHFPDGTKVDISDYHRGKITHFKPDDPPSLRDPQKSCASALGTSLTDKHESAPTIDVVNGHRAARIVRGTGTYWYALDAGCALIKRTLSFEEGGASNLDLVSLIPGEPSPALFAIPGDYKEVRPSDIFKPECEGCDPDARRRLIERLDAQYDKYRPNRK